MNGQFSGPKSKMNIVKNKGSVNKKPGLFKKDAN